MRRALALQHLQGTHNGENLAGVLLQIFDEYDIGKRIGFFIADKNFRFGIEMKCKNKKILRQVIH